MQHTKYIVNKLTNIRRQKRSEQLKQLQSSLRFSSNFESIQQITDLIHENTSITQSELRNIIQKRDVQQLYQMVSQVDLQNDDLLEQYATDIINCLKNQLSIPICVLTLGNLLENFEIYIVKALELGCFEELVKNLSNLSPGSKGQIVYLWVLCAFTEIPRLLKTDHLKLLGGPLQLIFKKQKEKQNDNLNLIRLIKNISEFELVFNEELVISMTSYFWKAKANCIKVNLYCLCCNLIERQSCPKSTNAFIHVLTVCLRGRKLLEQQIDKALPHCLYLLVQALKNYNVEWQYMQPTCIFELNGNSMNMGIHTFLLRFQPQLFTSGVENSLHLDFLIQFMMHSPIEQTIESWLQMGLFDQLVELLSTSPEICMKILKLLEILGSRMNSQKKEYYLQERIKTETSLLTTIEDIPCLFVDVRLVRQCQATLFYFQKIC